MGGVRSPNKNSKCILHIRRSSEPSFEVCGQSRKFHSVIRSKLGNYKTTLRMFELKSETRFEKQPETESKDFSGAELKVLGTYTVS